ncbi:MAG TPA: cytochrome c-type biogenesis protein CcmH [Bryobacteraceae bacterium]
MQNNRVFIVVTPAKFLRSAGAAGTPRASAACVPWEPSRIELSAAVAYAGFLEDALSSAMLRPIALLIAALAAAPAETAADRQARVERLRGALLAPCCYKEPVSRHQSEAALRTSLEIARSVQEGKSDRQILDNYIARYGAEVLAGPESAPPPWAQWTPWGVTAAAAAMLILMLRRWRAAAQAAVPAAPAEALPPYVPDLEEFEPRPPR